MPKNEGVKNEGVWAPADAEWEKDAAADAEWGEYRRAAKATYKQNAPFYCRSRFTLGSAKMPRKVEVWGVEAPVGASGSSGSAGAPAPEQISIDDAETAAGAPAPGSTGAPAAKMTKRGLKRGSTFDASNMAQAMPAPTPEAAIAPIARPRMNSKMLWNYKNIPWRFPPPIRPAKVVLSRARPAPTPKGCTGKATAPMPPSLRKPALVLKARIPVALGSIAAAIAVAKESVRHAKEKNEKKDKGEKKKDS